MERQAIRHEPEDERRELATIYREPRSRHRHGRGALGQDDQRSELALETHAREELGINPEETGNPLQAAASSFVTFALGALVR